LNIKLEMLTEASDDTAEQKKGLEMEITRLESENLEECIQQKKEEDRKKEDTATVAKAERDRKREEKEAEEEAQRVAKTAERDRKRAEKEAEEAQRVAKAADRDHKCAEKEADEAQRVAKAADRDHKCAEKEADEAQRVAKAAAKASERDAKWTAEVDAKIESMINDSVSFAKIASKLGNGLSTSNITNRWYRELKKSSGITKAPVQKGLRSSITWTADVDASII
jgi:membrane protein involved in colicin uptake